jgi:MYXO-CTERM domain-containing protein
LQDGCSFRARSDEAPAWLGAALVALGGSLLRRRRGVAPR